MPSQTLLRCVYLRHARQCFAVFRRWETMHAKARRETRHYDIEIIESACDLVGVDPAAPTGEPHYTTAAAMLLRSMIQQRAIRAVSSDIKTGRRAIRADAAAQMRDRAAAQLTRARAAMRAAESDLPAAWAAEAAARGAALAACELDADAAASARAAHKLAVAARVRAAARLRACRRDVERCDAALSAAQQRRDDETPAGRVLDGETRRDGSVRVLLGRGSERWIATYSSETLDRYDEITDAAGYVALVRTAQPSRTEFLGHSRRTAFANRKSTL